jgi:hypothetical protein
MSGLATPQELEYFTQRYGVVLLIALSLAIFLTPLVLRIAEGSPITPGAESYAALRQSELLSQGQITDPFHHVGLLFSPSTLLLALMGLFGVPWLLPPLLATLLVMLVYHYLLPRYHSKAIVLFGALAFVVSPAMSVLATWHTPIVLCAILLLVAAHVDRATTVLVALAVLASPALGILGGAGIVAYLWWRHRRVLAALCLLALGIAAAALFASSGPVAFEELLLAHVSPRLLFEFGMPTGVTIFFVIIAGYGLLAGLPGSRLSGVGAALALTLLAALFPSSILLLTLLLAVLVGHAIQHLLVAQWRLGMLQESLLILIACAALFLVITTVRERVADSPNGELSHALVELRNQAHPGAVLTAPVYSPLVEYYTGRIAALPSDATDISVFSSRNADETYRWMNESGVGYVLVTDEMRQTLFSRSDEGLLFLLQNSGRFVEAYSTGNTKVWYFIRT